MNETSRKDMLVPVNRVGRINPVMGNSKEAVQETPETNSLSTNRKPKPPFESRRNNVSGDNVVSRNDTTNRSPTNNNLHDTDLQEIAAAMELTDAEMSAQISDFPTFSLGFDFFGNGDDFSINADSMDESRSGEGHSSLGADEGANPFSEAKRKLRDNPGASSIQANSSNNVSNVAGRQEEHPESVDKASARRTGARFTNMALDEGQYKQQTPKDATRSGTAQPAVSSAQRPINTVHARPPTAVLSPLLTVRSRGHG